jgi:hypothetical protein
VAKGRSRAARKRRLLAGCEDHQTTTTSPESQAVASARLCPRPQQRSPLLRRLRPPCPSSFRRRGCNETQCRLSGRACPLASWTPSDLVFSSVRCPRTRSAKWEQSWHPPDIRAQYIGASASPSHRRRPLHHRPTARLSHTARRYHTPTLPRRSATSP